MENTFNMSESFVVLRNAEEQHSIWPAFKAVPAGWAVVKDADSKDACLKFVDENWVDMRPLSLRTRLEGPGQT